MNNQESAAVSPPQRGDWTSSTATSFFGRPVTLPLGWFVLALLLLLEWALFVQFFNRELAWTYPTGYDQAGYLSESYETFDHIVKDGLLSGLRHGLLMKVPQGKMMHLQAALLLLVAGPNRFTALSINFLYFAVLQCLAVYTLVWLTKRWSVAFLGLGLLLTTRSRFLLASGMDDFRLDHIAFCLFGIFVCLVVRSSVFASRRWSLVAALAAALLILFRFQSAVTLAASFGVLLAILGLLAWRSKDAENLGTALQRVRGLLSAGVLIAIMILPAVWMVRSELLAYYVGQVATDTKVRATEYGAAGAFGYWTFYLRSLLFDHLGDICCVLAVVILAVVFVAARRRPQVFDGGPGAGSDLRVMLLFLVVMFLVPLSVLTLWPIRNPVVGNILITPAIGLIMSAVVGFAGRSKPGVQPSISRILVALATLAMACGILLELSMAARRTYLSAEKESARSVLQLYDEIALRSRRMGWTTPRISMDRVQEYLIATLESVLCYERHGFLIEPATLLGSSIQTVPPNSALQAVKESDFAIITDLSSQEGPGFAYPFNVSMKQIQPQLHETAERYLVPAGHFQAFAHHFTLYVRPSVQVLGDSGGWITSQGLTLVAPAETFRARPNIELGGTTILAEYLGKMNVRAQFVTSDGKTGELPMEFNLPVVPKQAIQYKATIHLDPAKLVADGDVQVKLSFDKFFVPKEIGFNADTRQLVVMTPKQVMLLQ